MRWVTPEQEVAGYEMAPHGRKTRDRPQVGRWRSGWIVEFDVGMAILQRIKVSEQLGGPYWLARFSGYQFTDWSGDPQSHLPHGSFLANEFARPGDLAEMADGLIVFTQRRRARAWPPSYIDEDFVGRVLRPLAWIEERSG